ncbi:putative HTH-type transcriptional regulator [Mycobacterium talmoniae]|uniref:Putative HTH-type transcriptional regulator n=2 Tax=Mycobacterium talmoniae TaxID=1858794 RepID=A0A2S8BJE9_9MYCO|nr:putative HTH-type transcriptional regulator [Mycobacterium talmoniae]
MTVISELRLREVDVSTHGVLRSPASAALLVDLATEHGVSHADSLRGTPLTRDALDDLDAEVRLRDELQIISNIVAALEEVPGLGIEAGLRCHATSPGIWGLALMSSRTLGDAMSVGMSLAALSFCLCRLSVATDTTDGSVRLILDPTALPIDVRRFAVERDSTGIQTLQRDLLMTPDIDLRVAYTMARPPDEVVHKYIDVFGAEPEFGALQNCLIVSRESLAKPLPQANLYARSLAENQAVELLRQRSARAGVAGLLRDLMLANPSPVLSLDQAARQLTVSSRTLRRHLALEGASLRVLQEEVREALAEELLVSDGRSVAEIAERLGYSQVSSFTQAFRRWKGVGPREYRQQARTR